MVKTFFYVHIFAPFTFTFITNHAGVTSLLQTESYFLANSLIHTPKIANVLKLYFVIYYRVIIHNNIILWEDKCILF